MVIGAWRLALGGVVLSAGIAHGNMVITATVPGGDIPDADPVTGAPGVFSSDIVINTPFFLPLTGNNVVVTLLGLQHPWAGDLIVSLLKVEQGVTRDLFNRLGGTDLPPFGFSANFNGNYAFDGDSANDLWTTTAALGDADSIPDGPYFSLTDGHAPSGMSAAFNGLPAAGAWRLVIFDMAGGPDTPDPFPTFTGWQIAVTVVDVPEPSYAFMLLALGMAAAGRWMRRRVCESRGLKQTLPALGDCASNV